METFINSRMTISEFIAAIFDKRKTAGVAAMAKLPSGNKAAYTLFTDKKSAENCIPFFPAMPVNAAKAVSKFTRQASPSKEVAMFLRPCELRALTELVKIKQAGLDNLLLISFDCGGVFPFQEISISDEEKLKSYVDAFKNGKNCEGIRPVCTACTKFVPKENQADIVISLIGRKPHDPLVMSFPTEKGKNTAKALGIDLSDKTDTCSVGPSPAVESLFKERDEKEKKLKEKIKTGFTDTDGLVSMFDRCISCHACSYVCPICYCKNCYFDSQTFEYFSESYFIRMGEKGALRLPVDKTLFHVGRLSHMGLSCVACGMCEDACPVNIPVSQIFKTIGSEAQAVFDYIPGKDLNEALPLLTYSESELETFED